MAAITRLVTLKNVSTWVRSADWGGCSLVVFLGSSLMVSPVLSLVFSVEEAPVVSLEMDNYFDFWQNDLPNFFCRLFNSRIWRISLGASMVFSPMCNLIYVLWNYLIWLSAAVRFTSLNSRMSPQVIWVRAIVPLETKCASWKCVQVNTVCMKFDIVCTRA